MRHRLKLKVFDSPHQKELSDSYIPSTFTNYNHQNRKDGDDALLHSKSTYFYRWYKSTQNGFRLLNIMALRLLTLAGVISILSAIQSQPVNAITLTMTLDADGINAAGCPIDNPHCTMATAGLMAYRYYQFSVSGADDAYYIAVNTENGNGGRLINEQYPTFSVDGVGHDITPGTNGSGFSDNTWGYNLSTDPDTSTVTSNTKIFNTVPEFSRPLVAVPQTNDNDYTLTFATKLGNDAPSGHYKTNVYLSIITNPEEVINIFGVSTMQEMTSTICSSATEGDTARLRDIRDNKFYWVTKLKDGNCWMTQNLDLNLSADIALTPDDSNVSSNWRPANTTMTGDLKIANNESVNEWMQQDGIIQSWDPGNYFYNLPLPNEETGKNPWTSSCDHVSNMSACEAVTNGGWTTTTPTYGGKHYHVGNYYSWDAAIAGTANSIVSGQATGSICPKGWKLPTSNTTAKGSFAALMNSYNAGNDIMGTIRQAPLYFIPAGYVLDGFNSAGSDGRYWSSTLFKASYGGTGAYNLYFYASSINPSAELNRYYGYTIRCIVA